MAQFQISLTALLITVGVAAFALAGLAAPARTVLYWASGIVIITIGVLVTGILAALFRQESGRAYWMGFSLFEWSFFVLIFFFFDRGSPVRIIEGSGAMIGILALVLPEVAWEHLVISKCLLTLLLAQTGAFIAQCLSRKQEP